MAYRPPPGSTAAVTPIGGMKNSDQKVVLKAGEWFFDVVKRETAIVQTIFPGQAVSCRLTCTHLRLEAPSSNALTELRVWVDSENDKKSEAIRILPIPGSNGALVTLLRERLLRANQRLNCFCGQDERNQEVLDRLGKAPSPNGGTGSTGPPLAESLRSAIAQAASVLAVVFLEQRDCPPGDRGLNWATLPSMDPRMIYARLCHDGVVDRFLLVLVGSHELVDHRRSFLGEMGKWCGQHRVSNKRSDAAPDLPTPSELRSALAGAVDFELQLPDDEPADYHEDERTVSPAGGPPTPPIAAQVPIPPSPPITPPVEVGSLLALIQALALSLRDTDRECAEVRTHLAETEAQLNRSVAASDYHQLHREYESLMEERDQLKRDLTTAHGERDAAQGELEHLRAQHPNGRAVSPSPDAILELLSDLPLPMFLINHKESGRLARSSQPRDDYHDDIARFERAGQSVGWLLRRIRELNDQGMDVVAHIGAELKLGTVPTEYKTQYAESLLGGLYDLGLIDETNVIIREAFTLSLALQCFKRSELLIKTISRR